MRILTHATSETKEVGMEGSWYAQNIMIRTVWNRATSVARRSAVNTSATNSIPNPKESTDDGNNDIVKSRSKYKLHQCNRNTAFVGIICLLAVYVVFNLQQDVVLLDGKTTMGWNSTVESSNKIGRSSNINSKQTEREDETKRDNDPFGGFSGPFLPTITLPLQIPASEGGGDMDQDPSGEFSGLQKIVQPPAWRLQDEGETSKEVRPYTMSTRNHNSHLNLQSRNGTLVTLVHIGKTGGSALRELIDFAIGYCKVNHDSSAPRTEGSLVSHKQEKTTLQQHMCALARITHKSKLVHLNRNLDKTLSEEHFLVPIRNPIERLVSWFYYEKHFQTVRKTRYSTALNELMDPSRCGFATANELFLGKKQDSADTSRQQNQIEAIGFNHEMFNTSSSTSTLPVEATPEYCYKLSRDCLSGDIPCYGHNFFNYEYYLEDILKRVLESKAQLMAREKEHSAAAMNNNDDESQPTRMIFLPRVDVIRAEESWNDLNRTLLEWTGLPMTPDMDFFYTTRKPYDVDTTKDSHNKEILPEAARSMCESICPELIVYTKLLKYAANLSSKEKAKSKTDLEGACGFSIDQVCGKSFRYRKIRATKQSRMCEPRRKEDGGNDRHRRLAYLQGNGDLPPC